MKKRILIKKLKILVFMIGLFFLSNLSIFQMPIYALGPFLKINVTPANISFTIADAEEPELYYTGNQEVIVVSQHTLSLIELKLPWHLGIRSGEAFLKDSINPGNKIPISQLRWSKDGQNYHQLSSDWALVNSYLDHYNKPYEETITYRLYPEADQSLPAGLYSARIEFDVTWFYFP